MNLQEFSSALPKPWLDINCNDLEAVSLTADSVVIDTVDAKSITLVQQASVPNPAAGSSTLYCASSGILHVNDSAGSDLAYCANPAQDDLDLNDFNLIGSGHITPQITNAADFGTALLKFRDLYIRGIIGTTTNDNAQAGSVGQYVESTIDSGSAVALTTNTPADVTSISLTAGDWDVSGSVTIAAAGGSLVTDYYMGCSLTSATLDGIFTGQEGLTLAADMSQTLPTPVHRFSLAATTTVYLIAEAIFTVGTCGAYGHIGARRVR